MDEEKGNQSIIIWSLTWMLAAIFIGGIMIYPEQIKRLLDKYHTIPLDTNGHALRYELEIIYNESVGIAKKKKGLAMVDPERRKEIARMGAEKSKQVRGVRKIQRAEALSLLRSKKSTKTP